ncbi:7TM diverse intracellular signaling domain-containing protein [Dyadobacter sp. CY312]|uniref:sensor histidine kinase n=1 Tax=Dyadobacter sp. CY312 TaxID=2907303 RepID=UPI001F283C93|nr:7TM diverse intracellular signaling domain-containing protein [Dyadobacter sp. CY312]MCE7042557.1 ATP-binding protein [Dyadobacter sp. CY312]
MIRRFRPPVVQNILLFLLLGFTHVSYGAEIPFTGKDVMIGKYLEIAEDPSGSRTIHNLNTLKFTKSTEDAPNFGFSSSAWWIKFTVKNEISDKNLYLELGYPLIHSGELFTENDSASVQRIAADDSFYQRATKHQNLVFRLTIDKGNSRTYYFRVREETQIVLPLFIRTQGGFFDSMLTSEILTGIYAGILFVMMLYNLFLYFSIREDSYLYYVLYILFIGLAQLTLTGYGFKMIWPRQPEFNSLAPTLFSALSGLFAVLFFRNFLNTREKTPVFDKGLSVIVVAYVLSLAFKVAGVEFISYMLTNLAGVCSVILALVVSAILSYQNYRPAKFFLIAWAIFFLGLSLFVLRNLNILPFNTFTNYTMQAGTAIEVILLSFALADKINVLKREKELSQEQALLISLENERIITEQNVVLERNVEERTRELRQANTELIYTLTKLKDTQTQLIESEKMASLGQLTAGIAHEINNPINFVSSNIRPLRRDIDDLLQILDSYGELHEAGATNITEDQLREINDLKNDLDLDYIKTELNVLLKGMEDGAHRTVEIVKGLKMFARVDDTDLNMVDVNEGIESTLVILNYQMGPALKLVKDLGSIPNIEGYGGKLNQVFMNILTNSIHVIQNDSTNTEPTIWVKTWMSDADHVSISMKDNGTGMTPEVKAKIFEPFFTTKQVGEGTGLGLSIVFKIIEVHQGNIVVNTAVGQGTEFIITLPIIKKKNTILAINE